jgi:hypothetical protein
MSEDMDSEDNTLHIYSPEWWHNDAFVIGTRPALVALKAAIDTALADGAGSTESFVNDGEGFTVAVILTDEAGMNRLNAPYTDEVAMDHLENHTYPTKFLIDTLGRERAARLLGYQA